VSLHGFRLVFPATKEQPAAFNVRVESYLRDRRSVYIENVGTFKTPIPSGKLDQIERQIGTVSDFIVSKIIPFLTQYDRRDVE
ncbi:MAG: hypothetical protein VYB34_04980, partial [Planctomycetota bacterium]|nr:hypothetical protein [Planctomycetota bacterium]